MTTELRWTSADLESLPDDGKRYEIIDGELHVSKQPHWHHQFTCGQLFTLLQAWSQSSGQGMANLAPSVIFADDEDVVPDVVWISRERLVTALGPEGRLHAAPELAIEVLSPGSTNERRDREAKLKLYSRHGVQEYWIVDWRTQQIELYRRTEAVLRLSATLYKDDVLHSPLLRGFTCTVGQIFAEAV